MSLLPPEQERPSVVIARAVGSRVAGALRLSTFRSDLKWAIGTVGMLVPLIVGGYVRMDANAQSKVDTLETRSIAARASIDERINRVETKVDAILIGLHIPIPQFKDGGE